LSTDYYVLSARDRYNSPAMCCVVEFEDVIRKSLLARLIASSDDIAAPERSVVFCVLLTGSHINALYGDLFKIRKKTKHVYIYIFDCWNVYYFFFNKKKLIKKFIFPSLDINKITGSLCVPFRQAARQLQNVMGSNVLHIPLGVDTTLSNGITQSRPIDVMGYGRQPAGLTKLLSKKMNDPAKNTIFYHTDHMAITRIHDFYAHRRMFWNLLSKSKLALAYDVLFGDVRGHFPYSFVGQRWFESLAAGCVVVGKRPRTDEYDELLDWPDSTIELNNHPPRALEEIETLLARRDELFEIGIRNAIETRRRHDWIFRISDLLAANCIQAPPVFHDLVMARRESS
jgi:Glycosyl transferases group 1